MALDGIIETNGNTTVAMETELTSLSPEYQRVLSEQLNDEMTQAVLPVTVFVGIEMVLGFCGNLLVIYVFLFRYHVCNFRYFVLCLAFVDITSSLTTMPGEIITQLFWYIYPVPMICKVKSFFNVFTVSVEAFCLLTIAVDRYLKVCRPFGWQIKPKVAIVMCGLIYVFSFVLAVPVAIYWGTHSYQLVYRGETIEVTVCEKDEEFRHTNRPLHYSLSFEIIVSVCLVIMFVLYVLVARTLFQDKRHKNDRHSKTRPAVSSSGVSTELSSELSNHESKNSRYEFKGKEKFRDRVMSPLSDTCPSSDADEPSFVTELKQAHQNKTANHTLLDTEEDSDVSSELENLKKKGNLQFDKKVYTMHSASRAKTMTPRSKPSTQRGISSRVKRKTLIMFILTIVFILTTVLYMTLLSFIAKSVLQDMSNGSKAVYFFFFRLYFINHIINPVVYGILDPRFRNVMSSLRCNSSGD